MLPKNLYTCLIFLGLLNICISSAYPTFEQYAVAFSKNYSPEEHTKRKIIYQSRIQSFASITDYTPGINSRTDWTDQQIKGLSGLQELPQDQKEFDIEILQSARLGAPVSFDWREKNAVTSIKDQGKCGSCWAFATCAYAESKLILSNFKYTVDNLDLSEQYIFECTKNADCTGGYLQLAFQAGTSIPTDQQYPYNPSTSYNGICSAKGIRVGSKSQNYYSMNDNQLIALLQNGPIAISIASSNWVSYKSGIFSCRSTDPIDHAVLLVGYTPNYWIVKNQWGSKWGQSGYIRITRESSKNCKIGAGAYVMLEEKISKWAVALLFLLMLQLY